MKHTTADLDRYYNRIRLILRGSVGEDKAITLAALTESAGIPDRRTTEVLMETRLEDFGFSLVSGPKGYFRPTSPEHLNRYTASLESRIKCLSIRRKKVLQMALRDGFKLCDGRFVFADAQTTLF